MAGWTPHRHREESRHILGKFIENKKTFALEYQGKVIGSVGVEAYNEAQFPELHDRKGRSLGYVLSKDYWGQGLMPETVKVILDYLFTVVGLDFILIGHFDWNRQSARVIEKCGLHYYKTVPYETSYGTVERSEVSILYRSEWPGGHNMR